MNNNQLNHPYGTYGQMNGHAAPFNNQQPFNQQQPQFNQQPQQQYAQPQQYGQPAYQQPGFQQQPQGANVEAMFGFTDSYEDLESQENGGPSIECGIYKFPCIGVESVRATKGNRCVRLKFDSGYTKKNGTEPLIMEFNYFLLDKQSNYKSLNSKIVEKMRNGIFKTFGVKLPEYFNPANLEDADAIDRAAYLLNERLKGKYATCTVDWPDSVEPGKTPYREITWINNVKDYEYWAGKFEAKPKPASNKPAGGVPGGGRPAGGMPISNAPAQQVYQQVAQQVAQQQAPQQFQQPQPNFQQPQPQGYQHQPSAQVAATPATAAPGATGPFVNVATPAPSQPSAATYVQPSGPVHFSPNPLNPTQYRNAHANPPQYMYLKTDNNNQVILTNGMPEFVETPF